MDAIILQSIFCIENIINTVIAFLMVIGLSFATDFWRGSVTHKLPDNGTAISARNLYLDGTPALRKSSRITYGPRAR